MLLRQLKPDVYWVGSIDWDRRLFDALIPLPDGTSYNAYLVRGSEKTALIDTVDPTKSKILMDNLAQLAVKELDFIIVNHAEQDHSGTLPQVLELYPDARAVATSLCSSFLMDLHDIPEKKILTIEDGETLSLGNKVLKFIHTPWVHWPETMLTYLMEDRTLFTCDLFGSHLATSDLYAVEEATVYEVAKRYYAEIMMPFKFVIPRILEKIEDLPIDLIAPSHGPLYHKPNFIIEAYRDWSTAPPKNIVVVPYISMHGNTEKMITYLVSALIRRKITVKQFNLVKTDLGKLAISLVDASTVVIGSPAVLTGPHPKIVDAVYLINALRPKLKFASVVGSFGWGSRMINQITIMLSNLRLEMLDPVLVKGQPRKKDFEALEILAEEILQRHRKMNLL